MENDVDRARIWVLEDSALEAEMLRRALAPLGDVELFTDGSSVIESLANHGVPDVLVLDWQLPNLSGLEIARFVRQRDAWSKVPILMLTMYGRKQDVVAAFDAGANDYVTKPFDVTELIARVRTLARASRLQQVEARRSRQFQLAAEIGSIVTRAKSLSAMESEAVASILLHTQLYAATIVDTEGADGEDVGPLVVPPELVAASIAAGSRLDARIGPLHAALFPLGARGRSLGVLAVADAEPIAPSAIEDIESVGDLLALGMGRLRAESARGDALERERIARADAEAANTSKDDFIAMVSHELRTPLNAILGWTELLSKEGVDPARVRHGLGVIERNARSQAQLVDDLLDISRIISGNLSVEWARVELRSLVETVLETLRPVAQPKGVELVDLTTPAAVFEVSGDAHRLQQVVWNLVSNAVKFSDPGGRVTVQVSREAGDTFAVVVSDTGRGISAEFLPHVFERYRQADTSSRRTKSGLGLGLAIAAHFAGVHGGGITAASEGLGKGSTFTLTLPAFTGAPRARGPRPGSTKPGANGELRAVRIVVAEDDEDARELLTALLVGYGASVQSAASAPEAFEVVKTTAPDLLVSDIAMPGEDGLSLIRRIRQLPPEQGGRVSAIALTAFARPADRAAALRVGFQAHVAKPLDSGELIAVACALLETKSP